METTHDMYSESCNFVGDNNNNNDITSMSAGLCCHLEQPLPSNSHTDGRGCQSVEDTSTADSNVLYCSTDSSAQIGSRTDLTEKSAHETITSLADDAECAVYIIEPKSDQAENMKSSVEKNVDDSFVHKDSDESDACTSLCRCVASAHQLNTVHIADQVQACTAASEQCSQVTVEAVDNHLTFTVDTSADTTSHQNVLISHLDVQSEVECTDTNMTDSCQCKELKQMCLHLQTMLEQQLLQQERLQTQNERLAKQVSLISSDEQSAVAGCNSGNYVGNSLLTETEKAADTVLRSQYEECRHDKELMVLRYAQAEKKNLELQERCKRAELELQQQSCERELAVGQLCAMKAENSHVAQCLEARAAEVTSLKHDVERQKELVLSAEVQAKFHQTRLKEEEDHHRETCIKLSDAVQKVHEMSSDLEFIGQQLHKLNTLLEAQQVAGFPLTVPHIKDKLSELIDKQQNAVKHEACLSVLKEVTCLLLKQENFSEELQKREVERLHQATLVHDLELQLQSQQHGTSNLLETETQLESCKTQLQQKEDELLKLQECNLSLEQSRDDVLAELDAVRLREAESLEFAKRMTSKNSQLQAHNLHLSSEIESLKTHMQLSEAQVKHLETTNETLRRELSQLITHSHTEREKLLQEVLIQTDAAVKACVRVQELEDELKTVNRRHASNVKDLTRQLQAASRQLESRECRMTEVSTESASEPVHSITEAPPLTAVSDAELKNEDTPDFKVAEVDQQMLLDKIVNLQTTLASQSEKVDFLEDHIARLVEDIGRKNRIIQMYLLSQDSGTMSSEKSDQLKAELANKAGVMASLYSAQCQDSRSLSVELAVEICHKLQSVLEDTLLKNITLKESMDTLGEKVASLMEENQQLKLASVTSEDKSS